MYPPGFTADRNPLPAAGGGGKGSRCSREVQPPALTRRLGGARCPAAVLPKSLASGRRAPARPGGDRPVRAHPGGGAAGTTGRLRTGLTLRNSGRPATSPSPQRPLPAAPSPGVGAGPGTRHSTPPGGREPLPPRERRRKKGGNRKEGKGAGAAPLRAGSAEPSGGRAGREARHCHSPATAAAAFVSGTWGSSAPGSASASGRTGTSSRCPRKSMERGAIERRSRPP